MSVYRDRNKKNVWYAEVPTGRLTPSGRPAMTRRRARTKAEAERIERELKTQRDKGLPLPAGDLTVGDYLESWLDVVEASNLADSSKISQRHAVERYLIPMLGNIKLKDLHQRHVESMQRDLLIYRAPNTVRIIKRTLSAALKRAMQEDLVARNVVSLTTAISVPKRRELLITPEQIGVFIESIEGHPNEDIFLFLLHSGVRRGEACGLQWKDVHLEEQPAWITIRHSLSCTRKGFVLTPTKTTSSTRTIALTNTIAERLRQRRHTAMTREHLNLDDLDDRFVFAGLLGTPPRPDTITNQLCTLMNSAGLHGVGPHQLRHLYTTVLMARTDNITAISQHLGHTNIRTTVDIYGHRSQTLLAPLGELMDTALTDAAQATPNNNKGTP
jgi:integrase